MARKVAFVPVLVTVISTFGITPPDWSLTTPVITPVTSANAADARDSKATARWVVRIRGILYKDRSSVLLAQDRGEGALRRANADVLRLSFRHPRNELPQRVDRDIVLRFFRHRARARV